jgi:hypothetical protein
MAASSGSVIRKHVRLLEGAAKAMVELRGLVKTDGGHLNSFGISLVAAAKKNDVKQAVMARLLDVSATAVNKHYAKL